MFDSDSLYHRLFSHPKMVEDLLCEFVPDARTAGLDFSGLQRVNPKFHVGRCSARRREGDVIWRVPTRQGTDLYLYLLMEFQSRNDRWMAVRTQVYQGLLWQQVINETRLKGDARLPPVLLLVLYNGTPRWSAPTELTELIGLKPDSELWHWQPQARYYLLDMGTLAADESPGRENLAALLFRLEQQYPPAQLEGLIEEIAAWFRKHKGFEELGRLFRELVRQSIRSVAPQARVPDDLLEMKSMLMTLGEKWKQMWLTEGKAEGKAQGIAEGKAEALACLLVSKFGPLPPSFRERIRNAKLATIESWFNRALTARDLLSVFGTRHRKPPCLGKSPPRVRH